MKAAGGRIDNKEERELSGVISTAHRNTHFLEAREIAEYLGRSIDFRSKKHRRKHKPSTSFCPREGSGTARALPARADRRAALRPITTLPQKPSQVPVMFLLEEMATLERMAIIEQSGRPHGGLSVCSSSCVVQDFTQLKELYKTRWESFLANSALIQCFGTNDRFHGGFSLGALRADKPGQLSLDSAMERGRLLGDPAFRSSSDSSMPRRLITPDELMSLHPSVQVIALAAARPVIGYRPVYFLEKRFRDRRGKPLYDIHPSRAGQPINRAVDFIAPGLALGALLGDYLSVG